MRRIEIAAAMIEHHPELRHCFIGGYAEVTVIWFEDGLWFKARFDYLKPAPSWTSRHSRTSKTNLLIRLCMRKWPDLNITSNAATIPALPTKPCNSLRQITG